MQTLQALGVAGKTAYRRCSPYGPWRRLLPGVVALHDGPTTHRERVAAALLYAGPHAVVTGAEACRRYGLREIQPSAVHVLVPIGRKVHSREFVLVERTKRLPEAVAGEGVPLAPVTRALIDASRRLSSLDGCRAILAEAVQRGLTTPDELSLELALSSSRGSAIPRAVIAELASGAHSVAEIGAERLWKRAGLPTATWNGKLYTADGEYIATPDAWSDDVGFAWEIDSVTHHGRTDGFARTIARNARYTAAGVHFLQTLPSRIKAEPDAVIRELRAAYAAAAARPRPTVLFRERRSAA